MAGDHGLVAKAPTNYESVVHVPCFFRLPGRIPAGRQARGLVEAVDVMPTVLEAAGAAIPERVRGRSRWGLVTGATEGGADVVLIEHKTPGARNIKTLRTPEWKYWRDDRGDEILFDLRADPGEFVNRAADASYRERREGMREILLDKLLAVEDDLPRIAPY
jgi:arylsulfatase